MKNQICEHYNRLEKFALKLTKDKTDAEDLIQDTMLKALSGIDKFNGNNLTAWLFTLMKNNFINDYRKAKIRRDSALIVDSVSSTGTDSFILIKEIEVALNSLKNIEYLRMHMNGFKYREIAEAFNVPIGTVKSRIHLLRNEFIENYENRKI